LDNRLGVSRPRGPSFTLNIAVDALLKKEFDAHRLKGTPHPLMAKYGVDAIPFKHELLDTWRENFEGIQWRDKETGLLVSGAVDDIWVNKDGELMIVDYKATSKEGKIDSLSDSGWDEQYKRQMEVYQWLLRKNGFEVSNRGYFVYVNGKKDAKAFDAKLEFDVTLIPHDGDDSWVSEILEQIKICLDTEGIPKPGPSCEFCAYRKLSADTLMPFAKKTHSQQPTTDSKKEITKTKTKVKKTDTNENQNPLF
jgi:RecB family exonuclease